MYPLIHFKSSISFLTYFIHRNMKSSQIMRYKMIKICYHHYYNIKYFFQSELFVHLLFQSQIQFLVEYLHTLKCIALWSHNPKEIRSVYLILQLFWFIHRSVVFFIEYLFNEFQTIQLINVLFQKVIDNELILVHILFHLFSIAFRKHSALNWVI